MKTEYEATFLDVRKCQIRKKLKKVGAKLVKPEFLQKRVTFNLPENLEKNGKWVRVRDEKDEITMSFKSVFGDKIENQEEINLKINDFEEGVEFLERIGCQKKAYQETKREIWLIEDVEICIDEWPFLEPFVEIEGDSEEKVKKASKILGFDYSKAWFCSAGKIYSEKYGISEEIINNKISKITFDMENPFLNYNI